jgi:hypothetical protein
MAEDSPIFGGAIYSGRRRGVTTPEAERNGRKGVIFPWPVPWRRAVEWRQCGGEARGRRAGCGSVGPGGP